jgi:hypothetical protein
MEILKIDLVKLRNNEHLNCANEVKQLIAEHTAAALGIVNQTDNFSQALLLEEEAINPQLKSEKSDILVDDDAKRDDTFRGMADAVLSACRHFNPDVRTAANKLQTEVFKPFGNIARLSYNEETTAIDSLCSDLQTTYATECNTIGIAEWIVELMNDNANFKKTSNQRVDEASVKTQLKMKQVRADVDDAYKAIVRRIAALTEINGETNYKSFVNKLNVVLEKYATNLAIRRGRNKSNEETPTVNN